jgi:hypothetical protein
MKRLIAALFAVLAVGIAAAQEPQAAGFQNNAGGWTIITPRDQYCGGMNMSDGYAFGKDGAMYTRFCWVQRGNAILALLENNETRTWPVASFEMLAAEPEVNNNKL